MVSDGNNSKFLSSDLIDHAVGESTKKVAAPGAPEHSSEVWIAEDQVDDPLKLSEECEPKLLARALRVEGRGVAQLGESRRKDDELHFRAERNWARASSIGMA